MNSFENICRDALLLWGQIWISRRSMWRLREGQAVKIWYRVTPTDMQKQPWILYIQSTWFNFALLWFNLPFLCMLHLIWLPPGKQRWLITCRQIMLFMAKLLLSLMSYIIWRFFSGQNLWLGKLSKESPGVWNFHTLSWKICSRWN